ncbi:hypothetical protein Daus18300_011624 [Diaporthe australafricana]|uniref:Tat pathway signal sequence n=1 Tax=Diaporthe australafricana TaxID=127596 RepID=A0ABR3W5V0_9PEZI
MSLKWLRGLYSRWAPEDGFEKYNTVPEDDKSDFGDAVNGNSSLIASLAPQRRQSWRRPNSTQLILLGLSISLLTFTSLYINLRLSLRPPSRLHCGWTIEEAQARGCVFDTLSKAWLPSACPLYGLDEYMDAGVAVSNDTEKPWPFYRDKEHKQEISVREMSHMAYAYKGGPEFRTSNREHVTHCAWMLTRMAHAYSTGQRRDVNSDNFEHNKHCALFLLGVALKAPDIDDIGVRGNVIFGGC